MRPSSPLIKKVPLNIVGSSVFGRYSKISIEQTFNMIVSDDWLVPYAGHKNVAAIAPTGQGRAIYNSTNLGNAIAVIDNGVYLINQNEAYSRIGTIDTFNGDVFIAENNARQIAICDKRNIYIYDYSGNTTPAFQKVTLDFVPAHVAFQAGYFIATAPENVQWRLSAPNNGLSWPAAPANVGAFQTKADKPLAVIPVPGSSNQIMIFGSIVTQLWTNTGQQLFPYQLNSYFNIDYGCINPATIAALETTVVWVGINADSGPAIMFSEAGGKPVQISTDGINFKLAGLVNPSNAYGFLFKQDGHLIYQVTWPDANLTLAFDFNTKKFFTLTDEYMNYHIAKRVIFFNDGYYFVSINDGNLYKFSSEYTTYNGAEIPRVRVCKNIRLPDGSDFIVNHLTFTLEQGENSSISRIDFSRSIDGGASFSNYEGYELQPLGQRRNRFDIEGQGMANDFIPQFRFWGSGRFIATDGLVGIYQ
jgi:hypothetical protein